MTEAKLTRDAIVTTAISLADESGLDALSMRRIADRMSVGAMSLYRHIPNKDALLAAMTDEVSRRNPYPPTDGRNWTWRDRVRIAADIDWRLYQEHPWVLFTFAVPRYNFGEHSLIVLAWLVEGFAELGVDTREATRMSLSVWSYIAGVALQEVSARLLPNKDPDAEERSGFTALLDGDPHWPPPPALAGLEGTGGHDLLDPASLLESGLTALCDGFEARARV
ncbi:TetR/AcrR family transcriptional regulator [Nocardia huaxiensis]|uniref:TetR/AcrR family transcriptional regulator n=1 Tax=Nocardia huaxiensis TaxID=2755382 RepID=A0A7D6Z8Q0_9NOCA|nr:TetR/AcrR family transcriptional regulator [Nocardia huaxiensis]QLY27778.1 TetR/AcrR family transcriptional regulator [Nocardia huaxiensis]UFS98829.1 TetR/AcrR family transcriptional regulator [Nocardia huaxiensis]